MAVNVFNLHCNGLNSLYYSYYDALCGQKDTEPMLIKKFEMIGEEPYDGASNDLIW